MFFFYNYWNEFLFELFSAMIFQIKHTSTKFEKK